MDLKDFNTSTSLLNEEVLSVIGMILIATEDPSTFLFARITRPDGLVLTRGDSHSPRSDLFYNGEFSFWIGCHECGRENGMIMIVETYSWREWWITAGMGWERGMGIEMGGREWLVRKREKWREEKGKEIGLSHVSEMVGGANSFTVSTTLTSAKTNRLLA